MFLEAQSSRVPWPPSGLPSVFSTPKNIRKSTGRSVRHRLNSRNHRRRNTAAISIIDASLRIPALSTCEALPLEHILLQFVWPPPVKQTHMLYQLVRRAGGIPGPLAVLFNRTPVEVAEEKVPTLRVAPIRAARAREPSMVAERYRRFMTRSRDGREWGF